MDHWRQNFPVINQVESGQDRKAIIQTIVSVDSLKSQLFYRQSYSIAGQAQVCHDGIANDSLYQSYYTWILIGIPDKLLLKKIIHRRDAEPQRKTIYP